MILRVTEDWVIQRICSMHTSLLCLSMTYQSKKLGPHDITIVGQRQRRTFIHGGRKRRDQIEMVLFENVR